MRTATATVLLALVLPACGAPEQPAKPPEPKVERQVIKNITYFDVGTIDPAPPTIPAKVTTEVLLGVEVLARPLILECLVDAKNRGADNATKVTVDAKLTDAGVEHTIGGTNLTPAGTACIQAALGKWTAAVQGLNGKNGAAPGITAHAEFQHVVGATPAMVMGVNDTSDVVAAIRLALPTWGDCFADWKTAAPIPLKANVKIVKPTPATPEVSPAEITFDPTTDPVATKVAACLKTKLTALKVRTPSTDSIAFPYPFDFVHSGVADLLPGAVPNVQFAHLDLQRGRRNAEVTIVGGARGLAWNVYDAAVKSYKDSKGKTPTVKELKDKCAALLAADDQLIAAVEKQVATETTTQKFVTDQKAKDPSWADADASVAKTLAAAQKDLDTFKNYRKADEAACPKVRVD
jgi:hypothetical protein